MELRRNLKEGTHETEGTYETGHLSEVCLCRFKINEKMMLNFKLCSVAYYGAIPLKWSQQLRYSNILLSRCQRVCSCLLESTLRRGIPF